MSEDQTGRSGSIFDEAQRAETPEGKASPACSCRAWWKVAVVVALMAAVAGIIATKVREGTPSAQGRSLGSRPTPAPPALGPTDGGGAEPVLATVNGEPITPAHLREALRGMPEQHRAAFERSKHELLEELIARKLLLQRARASGTPEGADAQPSPEGSVDAEQPGEQKLINALLRREVLDGLDVSDAEVREFYQQHKDEMPDERSFEELKGPLRAYALREKRREALDAYLAKLRQEATITRNEDWIEAQKARAADNPLERALATGRPVVADFGRGTCVPCKMMKPILEDLKEEYAGRAEILIIDIDEYRAVTQRVGIRAIPTQVFYDSEGNEAYRHQGFMPREDIVEKLQEMGAA